MSMVWILSIVLVIKPFPGLDTDITIKNYVYDTAGGCLRAKEGVEFDPEVKRATKAYVHCYEQPVRL